MDTMHSHAISIRIKEVAQRNESSVPLFYVCHPNDGEQYYCLLALTFGRACLRSVIDASIITLTVSQPSYAGRDRG